jgi:RimJ/RimL family protein N-acetyltransferase
VGRPDDVFWAEFLGIDPDAWDTHPDFRGQGHGTAVVAAVMAEALANQELLLYQTLESNQAAIGLALALGYERYGNHVAVRLKRDLPGLCSA